MRRQRRNSSGTAKIAILREHLIEALEAKLRDKNEVLAELMSKRVALAQTPAFDPDVRREPKWILMPVSSSSVMTTSPQWETVGIASLQPGPKPASSTPGHWSLQSGTPSPSLSTSNTSMI